MYKNILYPIGLILFFSVFFSCRTTKHLKENQKLLLKNKIKFVAKDKKDAIDEGDLLALVRPRPNSKFLFLRFNLHIYNLYSPETIRRKEIKKTQKCKKRKDKLIAKQNKRIRNYEYNRGLYQKGDRGYKKYNTKLQKTQEKRDKVNNKECKHTHWTHKIGEKPVLYKTNDEYRNARQLRIYLKNKGYYYPVVKTKAKAKRRKKMVVTYKVTLGKPYAIKDTMQIKIDDPNIKKIFAKMDYKTAMTPGKLLDVDLLQSERDRITDILRNEGYYKFSNKYITFNIDTTLGNMKASVEMQVANQQVDTAIVPHTRYIINKINIYPNFNPRLALMQKQNYLKQFSLKRYFYNNHVFNFYEKGKPILKPKRIMNGIYISQDSLYNLNDIQATYKYLTSMEIIKIANIEFKEIPDSAKHRYNLPPHTDILNCNINISNNMSQARTFGIRGTNTNGNLGVAGSFTYTHRNLFKGAELFNFSIKGGLERQTNYNFKDAGESSIFFNSRELELEARIKLPIFLVPLKVKQFIKRTNPGTEIMVKYGYLLRPEFKRKVGGFSYGYTWNTSPTIEHHFKPVLLDYVELSDPSDIFLEYIRQYNLQGSYEDYFIFGSGYNFIYNSTKAGKRLNNWYLRINSKLVGNSLDAVMNWVQGEKTTGKSINNNIFAQFFKLDFDVRYYLKQPASDNTLVLRVFAGGAFPYGNLKVLPFGEKYFSGGANGIRAWHVRTLGPGSYTFDNKEDDRFPNRNADIKFEGNIEYRFKLFWLLEGATFLDIGNIWAINKEDDRKGALFKIDKFYREIAVGTGIGFRIDFDFFIIRFDFGLKLKDPSLPEKERWIPMRRSFQYDDWTVNIGIGYPF